MASDSIGSQLSRVYGRGSTSKAQGRISLFLISVGSGCPANGTRTLPHHKSLPDFALWKTSRSRVFISPRVRQKSRPRIIFGNYGNACLQEHGCRNTPTRCRPTFHVNSPDPARRTAFLKDYQVRRDNFHNPHRLVSPSKKEGGSVVPVPVNDACLSSKNPLSVTAQEAARRSRNAHAAQDFRADRNGHSETYYLRERRMEARATIIA